MTDPKDKNPTAADASAAAKPPRKSAMKLPEGVRPKGPGGPPNTPGWDRNAGGRPQRDAARRAGKSRKVH